MRAYNEQWEIFTELDPKIIVLETGFATIEFSLNQFMNFIASHLNFVDTLSREVSDVYKLFLSAKLQNIVTRIKKNIIQTILPYL